MGFDLYPYVGSDLRQVMGLSWSYIGDYRDYAGYCTFTKSSFERPVLQSLTLMSKERAERYRWLRGG